MARKHVNVDLLCYFFDEKKFPRGCRGIVDEVGGALDSRYKTRVRCRKCTRVVELEKVDLDEMRKEVAEEEPFYPSTRD